MIKITLLRKNGKRFARKIPEGIFEKIISDPRKGYAILNDICFKYDKERLFIECDIGELPDDLRSNYESTKISTQEVGFDVVARELGGATSEQVKQLMSLKLQTRLTGHQYMCSSMVLSRYNENTITTFQIIDTGKFSFFYGNPETMDDYSDTPRVFDTRAEATAAAKEWSDYEKNIKGEK